MKFCVIWHIVWYHMWWKFICMNHLNLFKIKFKIVSNIHWLKDSLSECHTIFVRIIFSWNYTRRMESQKYIYLDIFLEFTVKILGARSRVKNQNSSIMNMVFLSTKGTLIISFIIFIMYGMLCTVHYKCIVRTVHSTYGI